jgi:hypothetical protein
MSWRPALFHRLPRHGEHVGMTNTKPIATTTFALLALVASAYAAPAHAEPGSSIHRLPSDDAAGPEAALPTWAGVLIFALPAALVLIRAAILNMRARVRTADRSPRQAETG